MQSVETLFRSVLKIFRREKDIKEVISNIWSMCNIMPIYPSTIESQKNKKILSDSEEPEVCAENWEQLSNI